MTPPNTSYQYIVTTLNQLREDIKCDMKGLADKIDSNRDELGKLQNSFSAATAQRNEQFSSLASSLVEVKQKQDKHEDRINELESFVVAQRQQNKILVWVSVIVGGAIIAALVTSFLSGLGLMV